MIRNLIFDFGNVFVDLDQEATVRTLMEFGVQEIPASLYEAALTYEKGGISTEAFVQIAMQVLPGLSKEQLIRAWNAILLNIPAHRWTFLQELAESQTYRLLLLSNSNTLHLEHLAQRWGQKEMERFLGYFEGVYFSHEVGMRKPDAEIYKHILEIEQIKPEETFFVDDTEENTDAAAKLGLHVWHLKAGHQDISELEEHLP